MEEELNENELEERFYSMLHYVDQTQPNVNSGQDSLSILENAPRSTVRRYWRTSDSQKENTPYQKVNTPKQIPKPVQKPNHDDSTKPKEEKREPATELPIQLSLFQASIPQNLKNSIEIIESDVVCNVVEVQSNDEDDEVIEVALPPELTITIDSSDEDDLILKKTSPDKTVKPIPEKLNNTNRDVSTSPVPSIVSSVSDEFIRSDCIALNISSKRPDKHSFDFSLHGSDLVDQNQKTPPKKKKKKKNKETTSPLNADLAQNKPIDVEDYFATPKSKTKNKGQKAKTFTVFVNTAPSADVYDSDSNHSVIHKKRNSYVVTDHSLPCIDVYESDSNASETVKDDKGKSQQKEVDSPGVSSSDSSTGEHNTTLNNSKKNNPIHSLNDTTEIVDLTSNSLPYADSEIQENIIMGNVSGFTESEDYGDEKSPNDMIKLGSTKMPAILYENLDFDNLKGKDKVCKNRRYSLTSLRADMEKFYNESWGGEDFNHREIQKYMSRDKSLWAIDPKDRMPTAISKRKTICSYCNRSGHRDDMCRLRPPVCYMCGSTGHIEPRCPSKICVNCGAPNHVYSTMCRNCCTWGRITCAECGQTGHPSSHCPDLWRRYHNTVNFTSQLEENRYVKKHHQLFCSGCARRGHLVHTCRISVPFSGLPINSPGVYWYRPIYFPSTQKPDTPYNQRNQQPFKNHPQDSTVSSATTPFRLDRNKRQSNSPTVHESHVNKKRNVTENTVMQRYTKSPINIEPRNIFQNKDQLQNTDGATKEQEENIVVSEGAPELDKAPDFIPISSTNRDKKGQVIQDNEVSDTSDVVTSARIYVTAEIIDKLKTKDGVEWLKEITTKYDITVHTTDTNSFLTIKGKVGDQETFQSSLREWTKKTNEQAKADNELDVSQVSETDQSLNSANIPKNRNNILRKLSKALDSLKGDLGEPKTLYQELTFLQNRHQQLLKQKVINPKQINNNRDNINIALKKLNMVLLGQAGLADGSKHVSELVSLKEKLMTFRQKNISIGLRQEIGLHFHSIFTAIPRDDYSELLATYYNTKSLSFKKKKKDKSFNLNPKKKTFNTIPSKQKNRSPSNDAKGSGDIVETKSPHLRKLLVEKTINKLVFYHRRLLKARPIDAVLKKTKVQLVRTLHSHIASLGTNPNMSSKSLKKMKKIQERAQTFLNNV